MVLAVRRHHIDGFCCYVSQPTVFHPSDIAVAHHCHLIAVDADNAVDDVTRIFHPCQHHIANLYLFGFYQIDTLPAADNEWQHAITFHRKGDAHTFIDEGNGIADNLIVADIIQCLILNS